MTVQCRPMKSVNSIDQSHDALSSSDALKVIMIHLCKLYKY